MTRKPALISCLIATLALTAAALGAAPTSATTSSANVGVSAGYSIFGDSDAALAKDLDTAKAGGATWLRIDVDWSAIQGSSSSSFDWANTDRIVNAAHARGMQVDGVIDYTPGWAATGGGNHPVPRDNNQFATFAGQAAARYSGTVSTWEVWNEPNLQNFWGTGANGAAYTALLKAAYPKIKAAAPTATVLSAGVAPASTGGGDIAPETFVAQIYANGGKTSLDAVAVHPYSYPALPSDASTSSWNTAQKLTGIHNTMTNNGDGAKKIWLTEFGAPTGAGSPSVSEQQQSNIIGDGLRYFASLGFTGPVFIYNIRDSNTGSSDPEQNFGLVHTNWSVKPAYTTVQQWVGTPPVTTTPPPVTTTTTIPPTTTTAPITTTTVPPTTTTPVTTSTTPPVATTTTPVVTTPPTIVTLPVVTPPVVDWWGFLIWLFRLWFHV